MGRPVVIHLTNSAVHSLKMPTISYPYAYCWKQNVGCFLAMPSPSPQPNPLCDTNMFKIDDKNVQIFSLQKQVCYFSKYFATTTVRDYPSLHKLIHALGADIE